MTFRKLFWVVAALAFLGTLYGFQRPFREYPGVEYRLGSIPLPVDWQERTEWTFARLMYPQAPGGRYRFYSRGIWTEGGTIWTQDYPRADRHFSQAVRRLTRLSARSVEQPVNLDDGEVYDWPWLYAVQPGHWKLTDSQVKTLREYLLRGGFFMCDDFWNVDEWATFMDSRRKALPEHDAVELDNQESIFHSVYDLDDRYQVASMGSVNAGRSWKCENCPAHWRGIFDDKGRVMVAITFQSDVGDSWEWADAPEYPQEYAGLGIRIGVNYIVYAMTH
jgi:hypothetical protein